MKSPMRTPTIHDLHRAAMAMARATKDSAVYAAALSVLAGVKLRKTRVFCGLDEGRLSGPARVRLVTAKARYDHVVPCASGTDVRSAIATIGRCFTFGSYGMAGMALTTGGSVFMVHENSAPSAHGSLAAQFKLPVASVIAGKLDPDELLRAFLTTHELEVPLERPAWFAGTIVTAVPYLESPAAQDELLLWTGKLLRSCGPVSFEGATFRALAVVDPRCVCREGALRRAFGDDVVRLDLL